ncbi:MAG: hypothetical protein JNL96_15915 [Planctomycetaceae bacterium]|nr:hypothetical protein [Planctomycetaceae bacterium]
MAGVPGDLAGVSATMWKGAEMVVNRREFHRLLALTGIGVWLSPRKLSAAQFGIGNAIGGAAAAAVNQVMGDLIKGIADALLFIPLLLLDGMLNSFAKLLRLDAAQLEKLRKHRLELLDDVLTFVAGISNKPEAERAALVMDEFRRLAPKYRSRVIAVLRPEQAQRLQQIERQFQGVHAMISTEGRQTLALTDEQLAKLTDISEKLNAKIDQIRDGKERLTMVSIVRILSQRKIYNLDARRVLSAEQREQWQSYIGEPIDLEKLIPWDEMLHALTERIPDKGSSK